MSDLRIYSIEHHDDFQRCVEIQRLTWHMADLDIVPAHVLITAQYSGGVILGAWVTDSLVGFVMGFAGLTGRGRLMHHSHMAAVLPEYRSQGIGFRLKVEQARVVAGQGIDLITWTYDPLEARNAYFNLNRLGAIAHTYHVNHYGVMEDGLNIGLESDRFEVEQWLDSARVQRCLSGYKLRASHLSADARLAPAMWTGDLPQPPDSMPSFNAGEPLVEIPADFQRLKARDMGLARAWRGYFRSVCQTAFAAGFAATALERMPSSAPDREAFRTFYRFQPHDARPHP